jgi:hypothetical protein
MLALGVFNVAVRSSGYIACNSSMINEWERIWKEVAVAQIEVLSQKWPEGTKGNCKRYGTR